MSDRVLITGAGGFIGGRIAEVLHCSGMTVRAGIKRWSSAARIGRFDMEIVQADLMDPASIGAAMRGVTLVVNCARASGATTRQSMSTLLQAARSAGVRRVIHMSSVATYGAAVGELTESMPLARSGSEYGDSKILSEELCWEYAQDGLACIVLRPSIVYGPFSELWTVEFAERMISGRWMLPRQYCEGTCNLVYVDDLVRAVLCALRSESGLNEAYNINGPELDISWNAYFDALNRALGLPPLNPQSVASARLATALMHPVRKGAKMLLQRFQEPIMALYKRNALAKSVMKRAESAIRKTPTVSEFELYSRILTFPTTKAEQLLGYRPAFDMTQGVALSAAWLRHHQYAPRLEE
jgi:nucleoside-diphosphate-sugar epimerase